VLFYKDLARRLHREQPFYALQAHGVDGATEPLETFEEMAAAYVEEVRTVQPHGPYRLGGDCLGGVLAYEMAQQLRDSGEEVEIVAMFDSFHPGYRPHVPSWLYGAVHFTRLILVHHLPNVGRLPWREKWPYLRTKGVKAVKQVVAHVPLRRRGGGAADDPLARTQEALALAFDRYHPRPYDGRVALFRAERQPWGIRRDPLLGWGGVASRLECAEVPAYFQCGVLEPAVGTLAAELERRLDGSARARGASRARASREAAEPHRTTAAR
jgi:thioesterase domain-containing protein